MMSRYSRAQWHVVGRLTRYFSYLFATLLLHVVAGPAVNSMAATSGSITEASKPTHVSYTLPADLRETASAVAIEVTGTVTDASTGQGLPGVNVAVKGKMTGTSTGANGQYALTAPSEADTLVFSFVGYATLEVPIRGRSEINVSMEPQVLLGEELVVIGYGTVRKEALTGSVARVEGSDLADIPAARVDQILQGRAAGVQVTQVSGAPGAPSAIRIRGGNSIQGDNAPLFVVDGLITGSDFDLTNLNTSDIASIEVLKDATAISIYGTRGANGVVLITTKSGEQMKAGQREVRFNTYSGMQYMMNTVDFLNGPQHAAYANEDATYRGASLPFSNPDGVPDVDWVDQITRQAPLYNVDLSVTGRSAGQRINYYVSGNYFQQKGIIRNSGIEKYILRANMGIDLSDAVRAGVRLNTSRVRTERNKVNFSAALYRAGLPERAIYGEEGQFTATNPVSGSLRRNPEADIQLRDDHDVTTKVLGDIYAEVELFPGLTVRSSFSPEITNIKRNEYNPGMLPEHAIVNQGGDGFVRDRRQTNLLNENTVSYATRIHTDHELDMLAGFTWQKSQAEGLEAQGFGFPNDAMTYNNLSNGSDPTRNVIDSDWNSFQLVSWLGRANYTFKDRYLLTLVGRVDGSSRFAGAANSYGVFPSAAVAWQLGRESFIQEIGIFDELKLRASYGSSGSQAIASYRTLSLLEGTSAFFNDIEQYAVQGGRPPNENLTWETTRQLDIGLEAAVLNGRIAVEADFYRKKTEDLLLNVQIPRQTGFRSRLQNLGAIRNQGLEFTLNTVNIDNDRIRWTSRLTLAGNRNKVLDLGGPEFIDTVSPTSGGPGGRLIVGESAPVFVGVEYLGTWKSQDEIEASGQQGQQVGGPRFKDTDGDGNVTVEDFEVLGSPQPDFYGGVQNTVAFRNWELDIFIQGTYGNDVYNSLTQSAFFGRPEANKYVETLDRWTPDNPESDVPRAGTVATLASVYSNSKMVEDGSHLRLKNVRLSYGLPVERWGWANFKNLNVYVSGTNLLLLSNFRLFDPETSQYGTSNLNLGFSRGEYPYGRTLTLGVQATL